jgi:hypothetical protein
MKPALNLGAWRQLNGAEGGHALGLPAEHLVTRSVVVGVDIAFATGADWHTHDHTRETVPKRSSVKHWSRSAGPKCGAIHRSLPLQTRAESRPREPQLKPRSADFIGLSDRDGLVFTVDPA